MIATCLEPVSGELILGELERLTSCRLDSPLDHCLVLENIIEAIADGVMVISRDGVITLVNQALCSILGIDSLGLLGKGWAELFLGQDENLEFSQSVIEVIQSGEVLHNTQVPYTTPQGSERVLIATTSLIQEPKQDIVGVVAVFKDITEILEQNRRERALLTRSRMLFEERQEGLDRIARSLAHEMRNPVTALGGLAARLMRTADPKSREIAYYSNMLKAAGELEQIVTEVRKYAEIKVRPSLRTDLRPWLSRLVAPYTKKGAVHGVKIVQKLGQDYWADLDQPHMGLAICSLIQNALEAMASGGTLELELSRHEGSVCITITDNGVGIPAEDMPFLFDPFHTTKADRVGMSLAIAQRIVFEHQGQLVITSQLGQGTVCKVSLPESRF